MKPETLIVGIDLGTSNSCIASVRTTDGSIEVLTDESGRDLLPSVIFFPRDGEPIVGTTARNRLNLQPHRTIAGAKRLLGRACNAPEVQTLRKNGSWPIMKGPNETPAIPMDGRTWTPQQLLALVLAELRETARRRLGIDQVHAILTVPANYTHAQRKATMDTAALAGITIERLINEPTAAAMAYGISTTTRETIAVFDLGGGTFDVTVMEVRGNIFDVKATAGDAFLGGIDIDRGIASLLAERLLSDYQVLLDPELIPRLMPAAERIKIELSHEEETAAEIAAPWLGLEDDRTFLLRITREDVEAIALPLIDRALALTADALQAAGTTAGEIGRVLLVGGSTRMPLVARRVEAYFGKEPLCSIDPERAVAIGAATFGAALSGQIRRTGTYAPPVLIDVTPNGIGIETHGGFTDLLIPPNTQLPTERTRQFSTVRDNQQRVRLRILEGASRAAAQNQLLGELVIDDLPHARRGTLTLAVTFRLDAQGLLEVSAINTQTGAQQSTRFAVCGIGEPDGEPVS